MYLHAFMHDQLAAEWMRPGYFNGQYLTFAKDTENYLEFWKRSETYSTTKL